MNFKNNTTCDLAFHFKLGLINNKYHINRVLKKIPFSFIGICMFLSNDLKKRGHNMLKTDGNGCRKRDLREPQPHNDVPLIPLKKLKVLLVEDHPLIQVIHQTMLLDLNFQPDVASNAIEALELANHHYDLIILDIGLPDINGIELAKILKKMPHHFYTPLLALTANTDFNTQKSCFEAGITQVIHKPIDRITLAMALRSYQSIQGGSCS